MDDLSSRLRSWAQNYEMIDNRYLDHGRDCNDAADELDRLRAANRIMASLLECWLNPMLSKDDRWSISVETLDQLVAATKKTLKGESS